MLKFSGIIFPILFMGCSTNNFVPDDRYVLLTDDVSVEMTDPDFWLKSSNHPDRIIMTENEISSYNSNPKTNFDLFLESDRVDVSSVKKEISDYATFGTFYDKNGNLIDSSSFTTSFNNINIDNIAGKIRYAVAVTNGELRTLPTAERWYQDKDNALFDNLILTKILVNEPLFVLHESADRNWFFVQGQFSLSGWINKENIAFCKDKQSWLESQSGDFLIVAANRTRLQMNDPDGTDFVELTMGTKLKLISPDFVVTDCNHRFAKNVYAVSFPIRNDEGALQYSEVFIPARNDVHVGYLPYTERNILNLAFSCLGDRYGWGGMFASRDCSSFVQDIFRCFGIKLPRNSSKQAECKGKIIDFDGCTLEQKFNQLKQNAEIGSLLYMPGHVVIYLGVSNDKAYIINELSSLMIDGRKTYVQSVTINSMDDIKPNGKSFLELVRKCIFFSI